MPADRDGPRASRKGYYACEFCRARKLRCDRQLPCANCASRGRRCCFETRSGLDETQELPQNTPTPTFNQPLLPHESRYGSLLREVVSLKKLAHQLEERVSLEMKQENESVRPKSSLLKNALGSFDSTSPIQQVGDEVTYLERVSIGQNSYELSFTDDIIFRIENIRNICQAPTYTTRLGQVTRCVWLPRYEETKELTETFVTNVGYIAHIIHHPSLPDTIDDIYRQLAGQEPKKPGHLILILAILANATYSWVDRGIGNDIFPSSPAAYSQVNIWVKAAQDVLNASQYTKPYSLEAVQGIIMLSFAVANMEGFSPRYRYLMSTALWLSHELGLHHWDAPERSHLEDLIRTEVGRRVWWYLVSTDWLLASRYKAPTEGVYQINPKHMVVKKPRNVDDADLFNSTDNLEKPLSQPTEMSYFLQRLRLAEISRDMVDRSPLSESSKRSYADVVAADTELDKFTNDIPPFFNLENYDHNSACDNMPNVIVQSYMLNCHVHMQRCKLHIPYLTTDPNNLLYSYSRKNCLMAARNIIRNELKLEESGHTFIKTRLRFSAILHGVFMASIVLLMDACVNKKLQPPESRNNDNEVSEAFRLLECARSQSLAASNLLESLMQVLRQHGLRARRLLWEQEHERGMTRTHISSTTVYSLSPGLFPLYTGEQAQLASTPTDSTVTFGNADSIGLVDEVPGRERESQPTYFDELARSLECLPDVETFQWDDVLSTLDSSLL